MKGDEFVKDLVDRAPRDREYGWRPESWRKIFAGVTYSTETASSVAVYEVLEPNQDYRYEELFQTPKGRFILVGEGKSDSPWSKPLPDCNSFILAHSFVPLTHVEAKKWLEVRGKDDAFIEIFGEPGSSDENIEAQVLLRLPPILARRVKEAAERAGTSQQQWIRALVDKAFMDATGR